LFRVFGKEAKFVSGMCFLLDIFVQLGASKDYRK
jgi:hypothetical protein